MSIASLSYDITNANPIGLASLENASKMLADFGRNGDTYVVHAKEGETVIPLEVLDNNPKLKDMLFQQMRDLDLDPYRYIVGNELNSINPATGQPEFFLKKLFKGLKKTVKKFAPMVLPIVAPYLLPTMPLFLSAGIGSLAGSLAGGAKPRDALRNAVVAGGLAGLGNMAFGQGGFSGSAIDSGLTKGDYDIRGIFDQTTPTSDVGIATNNLTGQNITPKSTGSKVDMRSIFDKSNPNLDSTVSFDVKPIPEEKGILDSLKEFGGKAKDTYNEYFATDRPSIMPSKADIMKSAQETANAKYDTFKELGLKLTDDKKQDILLKALETAEKDLAPSAFQKYAPLGGATALGLYGLDQAGLPIFTVPEEDEGPRMQTGLDLLLSDPDKYKFTNFYGDNPYYQNRADGGEIVGPGTSTSDSIPAMLSDGEFVMNARAVQGAGGGDRKAGAKRMYQMMKKFEKVA